MKKLLWTALMLAAMVCCGAWDDQPSPAASVPAAKDEPAWLDEYVDNAVRMHQRLLRKAAHEESMRRLAEDGYVRPKRKQPDARLVKLESGREVYVFQSSIAKYQKIREHATAAKEARELADFIEQRGDCPIDRELDIHHLRGGDIGRLPMQIAVYNRYNEESIVPVEYRILQIINESAARVAIHISARVEQPDVSDVIVRGIPTAGLADGVPLEALRDATLAFYVSTEQYTTVMGATRTVFTLERIDVDAHRSAIVSAIRDRLHPRTTPPTQ